MERDALCYLPAGDVDSPVGSLADLRLCNSDDETVGTVDGVLIDPPARCVRYFVVKPAADSSADRFLVSPDAIIRVEPGQRVARMESSDVRLLPFDPRKARRFTEDDAVTAMFSAA